MGSGQPRRCLSAGWEPFDRREVFDPTPGTLVLVVADPIERLAHLIGRIVESNGRMKARNGLDPLVESQAANEIDAGFTVGPRRPVLDAFQMAEWRLLASIDHLGTAGRVLHDDMSLYAVAGLARLSIETSARAAWLLDPKLDGRRRGLRAMTDLLNAYKEEAKIPGAADESTARIEDLVADARAAGIDPVMDRKTGSHLLHFGEPHIGSIDVVKLHAGEGGELAYRELSGIAHAAPTALFRRVKEVPIAEQPEGLTRLEGVKVARPTPDPANLVPTLGVVIDAYLDALDLKVSIYGWSQTVWRYNRKGLYRSLAALVRPLMPPGNEGSAGRP